MEWEEESGRRCHDKAHHGGEDDERGEARFCEREVRSEERGRAG